MNFEELDKIFQVKYGNKFDANKMQFIENGDINFISRNSNNNGCVGTVKRYNNKEPFESGLITVSLGGSFLLSSFLQPKKFYTAQNVAVLIPRKEMNVNEKLFYCKCISMNRFKYSAFGREANKTLRYLKVPKYVPDWINKINDKSYIELKESFSKNEIELNIKEWKKFKMSPNLFKIVLGEPIHKNSLNDIVQSNNSNTISYITRTTANNGVELNISRDNLTEAKIQEGNAITIGAEGIMAFYQKNEFVTGNKINILYNVNLNEFIAMFLNTVINLVIKKKFSYGRGLVKSRLEELEIRLPIDKKGEPDWKFMENYIKSLKYSKELANLSS